MKISCPVSEYCLSASFFFKASRSVFRRRYHVRRDIPSNSHNFRLSSEGALGSLVFFSFFGNSLNTSSSSCSDGWIPNWSISVPVKALYNSRSCPINLSLNELNWRISLSLRNCKPFSSISFCVKASKSFWSLTIPACAAKFIPQNTLNSRCPSGTSPRLSFLNSIKRRISANLRPAIPSNASVCPFLDLDFRFVFASVFKSSFAFAFSSACFFLYSLTSFCV